MNSFGTPVVNPTTNNFFTGLKTRFGNFATSTSWVNMTITILLIIVILLVIAFLFVRLGYSVSNYNNDAPFIVEDTIQGTNARSFPGSQLLRSYDKKFGLEFSYTFWLYIDENTFNNSGKWHHIFHKGNSGAVPLQAPGVWIYPSENKLAINMNTENQVKASCDIGNIPLNKWVCICIVVIGQNMDVYINAKLKKRCNLGGIPKQNYGDLYMGKWGGFNGFLSRFRYYSYAVPFYSIEKIYQDGPSDAPCTDTGQKPPYLSPQYWMTTGFPNTQIK